AFFLHMDWGNANENAAIEVENKTVDYYTYLDDKKTNGTIIARAFKKLIYKNIYPGIDAEYSFHETEGMKYAFILHPGADPSVIKMQYTGAENIFTDEDGNVHFTTRAGDITDHAPHTYYADDSIPVISAFIQQGNEIRFHLENYDPGRKVIIDPWTINPGFSGTNSGWDITTDGAGNIYCQGGGEPFYLKKFDPSGLLLWTFTYPNATSWPGDFTTTKAGFSYITYGAWIGTHLTKIDPSGTVIFNNTTENNTYPNMEGWRVIQNCRTGALYGAGFGYISSINDFTNIFTIDTSNGNFSNYTPLYTSAVEVRSINYSGVTGDLYVLELQASSTSVANGNRIIRLDSSLNTIFNVADGYPLSETQADYYPNDYGGFNGIALGCYLYTCDGHILKRWDKTTGAQLGNNVNLPDGSELFNGGLFVDRCGSVYAGSSDKIVKYDALLNQLTTAITDGPVYDICSGNMAGEILVCGKGFISSINMEVCIQPEINITTVAAAPCTCTGSAIVTANNNCDSAAFTFLWEPTGEKTASVNNLCPGIYTVTVTDTSQCFNVSVIDTVTIAGSLGGLATSLQLIPSCNNPCNGSATAIANNGTPPYTYLWSNSETTATITGLCGGIYAVTVTDSAGCTHTESFTLPASQPITISSNTTIATCLGNNGSISITINGGTPPFQYFWSNGETTKDITDLAPGDYDLLVTDSNGCTQTLIATIGMEILPVISISSQVNNACSPQQVQFISDSTGVVKYQWDFGDSTQSNGQNPIHEYQNAGTYIIQLIVTSTEGCLDSIYSTVTIESVNFGVNISNAFSPNSDGVNDVLKPIIKCSGNLNYTFSIFNRWGELIFETHDPGQGWNGKYNGKGMPVDVYPYYIKYDCNSCSSFLKGNVTLVK
ncbi:MAG: PKD domain-containing protein, partial [Chitinophagales bacterium]